MCRIYADPRPRSSPVAHGEREYSGSSGPTVSLSASRGFEPRPPTPALYNVGWCLTVFRLTLDSYFG